MDVPFYLFAKTLGLFSKMGGENGRLGDREELAHGQLSYRYAVRQPQAM